MHDVGSKQVSASGFQQQTFDRSSVSWCILYGFVLFGLLSSDGCWSICYGRSFEIELLYIWIGFDNVRRLYIS